MLTWDEEIKPTSPFLNQRSSFVSCAAALSLLRIHSQAAHAEPAPLTGIDY